MSCTKGTQIFCSTYTSVYKLKKTNSLVKYNYDTLTPFEMCVLSSYFYKHMLLFFFFMDFIRCKTVTRTNKQNYMDELSDCNISFRSYS